MAMDLGSNAIDGQFGESLGQISQWILASASLQMIRIAGNTRPKSNTFLSLIPIAIISNSQFLLYQIGCHVGIPCSWDFLSILLCLRFLRVPRYLNAFG